MIREPTVSLFTTLIPKSPWKILPIQMKYCSINGLSRPIRIRRAAISSSVARSPSIAVAGSPGTRWINEKITIDTMINTGMTEMIRFAMNRFIDHPPCYLRVFLFLNSGVIEFWTAAVHIYTFQIFIHSKHSKIMTWADDWKIFPGIAL